MTTRQRLQDWYDKQQAVSRAEGRQEGRAEGRREGRAEGQRNLLAKLLKLKFGPLDAATEDRLAAASLAELGSWAERVLSASSLAEIWD